MKRLLSLFLLGTLTLTVSHYADVLKDNAVLKENTIRLHVVANSDKEADQCVKLKVRDAVNDYLRDGLMNIENAKEARAYIRANLTKLEELANAVLSSEGFVERTHVTLTQESFDTRYYDTFTLPSGVYHSLRIVIGEGEGHNWWCVVFPSLCIPAGSVEFEDMAVSSGFSESLAESLSGQEPYEIRFYLLECLGKVENFFFEK